MKKHNMSTIEMLKNKGVEIPNPESVLISETVNPERIAGHGVVIYAGCKIIGESTLILPGAKLGYEGPAVIENCQVGPNVQLKGGFFKDAVFLDGVSFGLGAHVRGGTIMEEKAGCAHTVGLKQTILFPFVTLGSLINFCDCFMSGGTGSVNHSEVGSSFIHFNYTPNQDKATASLMGDVPRGVMLNQAPIFLGGQGGIVGPVRLEFGTITAAGSICRKDELRPGYLIVEGNQRSMRLPFAPGGYRSIARIINNNIIYLANLAALKNWYEHVRPLFISTLFPEALLAGLKEKLQMAYKERVKRLGGLRDGIQALLDEKDIDPSEPLTIKQQREFAANWSQLAEEFVRLWSEQSESNLKDDFLSKLSKHKKQCCSSNYVDVIQGLDQKTVGQGTRWLQGIVDAFIASVYEMMPLFN